MSAFMCGRNTFARIHNILTTDDFWKVVRPDAESAMEIIEDWYEANRKSIGARYGDKDIPKKLCELGHMTTSLVQGYKSIRCLKYQCSEEVKGSKHKRMLEEMKKAAMELAEEIVDKLPEFNDAEWG